jgi:hypothetical protein
MRSVRMILGLAVVVCAFGALTAPAFAKVEEPIEFGKFVANATGVTKGHGEAGEMAIGPYKFPNGCEVGGGVEEPVSVSFTLGMEFHSNGFAETGEGAGVEIKKATVKFKAKKSYCEVNIPTQFIPNQAEKKPEKEFEAFSYKTEKEKLTGSQEKKFGEFRERLAIEWEFKGFNANVPVTPTCEYRNGEEGGKLNPVTKEVEFSGGKMEGELEEITLKGGNLKFVPKV